MTPPKNPWPPTPEDLRAATDAIIAKNEDRGPSSRVPSRVPVLCRFCGAELVERVHARCILLLISSEGVDIGEDQFAFCGPCGKLVHEAFSVLQRAADAGARRPR